MLHRKTNSVLLSIVNEHNGVCVCSLTLEDLPPHNNPVVGLVAIPIDSKFVLILAQESLFLFDVWLMKVVG